MRTTPELSLLAGSLTATTGQRPVGQAPCLVPGTNTYIGCIGMSTCRASRVLPRCIFDVRGRAYGKLPAQQEVQP